MPGGTGAKGIAAASGMPVELQAHKKQMLLSVRAGGKEETNINDFNFRNFKSKSVQSLKINRQPQKTGKFRNKIVSHIWRPSLKLRGLSLPPDYLCPIYFGRTACASIK